MTGKKKSVKSPAVASSADSEDRELSWLDCYDVPGRDLFAKVDLFAKKAARERSQGQDFFRRPLLSANLHRVPMVDPATGKSREMIMLGSNSYLGLTHHPRVVNAAIEATKKYGYGSGSVPLYSGTTDLHIKLERKFAEFYKCEDAILFPTGYAANVGTISALLRDRDVVINDLFNHASIYDGCKLSGAKMQTFVHGNMKHLERVLKNNTSDEHGTLVITDGVFSMEGDIAKLDEILEISHKYGAKVMLDDSHAIGVIGKTGKGTAEHCGVEGKVDITLGTLSKCLGGIGGCIAGSHELIDYLRFYGRSYFFSGSIPTPIIAGVLEILDILQTEPQLHAELWKNVNYMCDGLRALGFDLGNTESAIIPVIVGEEQTCKNFLKDLLEAGIFMNFVAFPAVPKTRCRLRMSMMTGHTKEDLDYVIKTMAQLGRKYELIK